MSLFLAVAIKFAKKHLVDGSEEALDAAAPLRFPWRREYKPDLEIDSNLFDVLRREIRSIVGIENFWDAADLPMWMALSPDRLSKGKGGSCDEGGSKPR